MKAFILLILISLPAWPIPEEQFPEAWTELALPYFKKTTQGSLTRANYFYLINPKSTKSIVILPGRTEPAIKYAELLYDLRNAKANIFILDHEGQGTSPRTLKDTTKGHVIHFNDYVKDVDELMKKVVLPKSEKKPIYLLAHSMGGAIGVHYMAQNPKVFKKAVLSAPMLEINTAPYTETIARYYAKLLVKIGKGQSYAPGWGPYQPDLDIFPTNIVTNSEARFDYYKYLFTNFPELIVWGPTARWVHESLLATKTIDFLGSKIETPILLFQAGCDVVVMPGRQTSFCKKANCEIVEFPEAKHEILMERDEMRSKALSLIQNFFR